MHIHLVGVQNKTRNPNMIYFFFISSCLGCQLGKLAHLSYNFNFPSLSWNLWAFKETSSFFHHYCISFLLPPVFKWENPRGFAPKRETSELSVSCMSWTGVTRNIDSFSHCHCSWTGLWWTNMMKSVKNGRHLWVWLWSEQKRRESSSEQLHWAKNWMQKSPKASVSMAKG